MLRRGEPYGSLINNQAPQLADAHIRYSHDNFCNADKGAIGHNLTLPRSGWDARGRE